MSAATADGTAPKITGFVCGCTLTEAPPVGSSEPRAGVGIVRLPCTARIDPLFVVKAFERGSDGVIISGCWGDEHTRRRFAVAQDILGFMGIDPRRITISWLPASEGADWQTLVNMAMARARDAGPFEQYRALARSQA